MTICKVKDYVGKRLKAHQTPPELCGGAKMKGAQGLQILVDNNMYEGNYDNKFSQSNAAEQNSFNDYIINNKCNFFFGPTVL